MSKIPPAEQSVASLIHTIHDIAGSHAPVEAGIGLVIQDPPDIQIAWNNIILTRENLYIDVFLLKNYGRFSNGDTQLPNAKGRSEMDNAKGDIRTSSKSRTGGFGKARYAHHNHKINNSYKADISGNYKADITSDYYSSVIFTDFGLRTGDFVSLLPIQGGQQFIILSKVFFMGELTADMFKDSGNKPTTRRF